MNRKVGFFRSVHFKLIAINVLLILIALQVIGVYFVRQLEKELVTNYSSSLNDRLNLLVYNVEQEFKTDSNDLDNKLESNIQKLLLDFASTDIDEVRVIDYKNKILGTSDPYNQSIVGKRTTDVLVKRTLLSGVKTEKVFIDQNTGHRIRVIIAPVKENNASAGVVYLMASMEGIYNQVAQANKIFITGMLIAMGITVIIGIVLAQTITRPISDMRKQAMELSKGNYSRKVKIYGYDEIGQLAMSFNLLTKRLKEARSLTEGERTKLSSVLKHMRDGVIATDYKGRVILINEPALKMLGVSRETIISGNILDILGIQEKYSLDDLYFENDSIMLDHSSLRENYIIRTSFSVIQDDSGEKNGLIAVLYDVTEQEVIDRERREFVANVSHELRTPLTTMRSYLEALTDGAWKDEEIAPNFLNVTQNETERMIRLVSDLLQLSKMDSKDYRLFKDWINFTTYFHTVIDRFEMTKPEHIHFHRNIQDDSCFVAIDDDKITQVLDNIISNAIKYSPDGGNINFYLKSEESQLHICVSDEGVGVPKDQLENIFDRFYRVDKARSRKLGGTGLGLAIAKEMIEAHGGRIWAESVEGKGTSIHFTLPINEEYEEDGS